MSENKELENVKVTVVEGEIEDFSFKNEQIMEMLSEDYNNLIREDAENKMRKKPLNTRFGYRLKAALYKVFSSFGMMDSDDFKELTCKDLKEAFMRFTELMAGLNEHFEVPIIKQDFLLYLGINERMFKSLMKRGEDMEDMVQFINDNFIGLGFSAAESGNMDSKSTLARLKIKNSGMDLVENDVAVNIYSENKELNPKAIDEMLLQMGIPKLSGKAGKREF